MKVDRLLICADASVTIGMGHVMRCLAIGQAWKRAGGSVSFFLPGDLSSAAERVLSEGFSLQRLPPERGQFRDVVAGGSGCQRAVLDGYGFGRLEQVALSDAGVPVLFLDDYGHADQYSAQWVLNQNLYAHPEMYSRRDRDTRLLLGPTYALLREEFLPWLGWKRRISGRGSKILVTMGGSDAGNASSKILEGLAFLGNNDIKTVLVLGASNPHFAIVREAAAKCPVQVRIVQNSLDMSALMAWADVAIAAAGGTSYELCYMGLPSVLFIAADNQRRVAESLAHSGVAANAGGTLDFNRERFVEQLSALLGSQREREAMSRKACELVDGLGADRVRAALLDRDLELRPVQEADCQLLFEWANDPVARAASFQPGAISWEDHARWFALRLQDPQSVIYIGENVGGEPVGLVRFHLHDEEATLSIIVAPKFRGGGWGKELISFSIRLLARTRSVRRVDAFVKPDNPASTRLFESTGFRRVSGAEQIAGQAALLFTWECGQGVHAN